MEAEAFDLKSGGDEKREPIDHHSLNKLSIAIPPSLPVRYALSRFSASSAQISSSSLSGSSRLLRRPSTSKNSSSGFRCSAYSRTSLLSISNDLVLVVPERDD
jgi:hypothetical protein